MKAQQNSTTASDNAAAAHLGRTCDGIPKQNK